MNQNQHRIIFNAARGQLMVVSEAATAQGKCGSGETTAQRPGRVQRLGSGWSAMAAATALLVGISLTALAAASARAQIVADPNAPRGQQPTVLVAPNGAPVVNIQTPSAAGVSRNTYSQFDVQANGAVLNNSRTNVQTQLGGWVQGNPWLATGSARVIINEVNSAHPSQLRGFIEVAGQRAEIVIANPAGINVDGAGFINASRATLTTGTPELQAGALESFRVQRGTIQINGAGLDATLTDHTGILARAIEINAGIWANDLQVVAGANTINAAQNSVQAGGSAASGPAPSFALDVSELGGMYAGKIRLVGTEAGLGVRNAGTLAASAGALTLDAAGWLSNSGTLQASESIGVAATGDLSNSGNLFAQTQARLQSGAAFNNSGRVDALAGLASEAQSASNSARLASGAELSVQTTGVLRNSGEQVAATELRLRASDIDNQGGQLQARRLDVQANTLDNRQGSLWQSGAQDLGLALGQLDNGAGRIGNAAPSASAPAAAPTPAPTPNTNPGSNPGSNPGNATTNPSAGSGTASAPALATGSLAIAGQLRNDGGRIEALGSVDLTTANGLSNRGSLAVRQLTVQAGNFNNNGGTLVADQASIQAQQASNAGGQLSAQTVHLSSQSFDNRQGSLSAANTLTVSASQSLDNTGGHLQALGGAAALNAGVFDNTQGSVYAATDLSVQATSLNNAAGQLHAEGAQTLAAQGAINNAGRITAAGNTTVSAQSLSGNGLLAAGLGANGTLLNNSARLQVDTQGALQTSVNRPGFRGGRLV